MLGVKAAIWPEYGYFHIV